MNVILPGYIFEVVVVTSSASGFRFK